MNLFLERSYATYSIGLPISSWKAIGYKYFYDISIIYSSILVPLTDYTCEGAKLLMHIHRFIPIKDIYYMH